MDVSCSTSFKSSTFLPDFEQDAPTGTATPICSSQQKLAGVKSTTQISVYPWEKAKPRGETSLLQEKKSLLWMKGLLQPPLQRHRQGTSNTWSFSLRCFTLSPSPAQGKAAFPGQHFPFWFASITERGKRGSLGSPGVAATALVWSGGEEGERWQLFQGTAWNGGSLSTLECSGCCLSSQPI